MNPKFSWEKNKFDSTILGFECAKISNDNTNGKFDIHELIENLKKKNIIYATIRIPSHEYLLAHILEENSFLLVDGLVSLSMSLKGIIANPPTNIRIATEADTKNLTVLAHDSFSDTRFFHDKVISNDSGHKIYSEWMKNSINGLVADKVLVYVDEEKIKGFVSIQKNGHIPLLAVNNAQRGKGIGKQLCCAALAACKELGAESAFIETQVNNIPALRAYISAGFKITDTHFTFRWYATI